MGKKHKKRRIKKAYKRFRQFATDILNKILFLFKPKKIVNQQEVRIFGLKRSGNHAFINWLFDQSREVKCFLNDIPANCNPFIYFQKHGTAKEFQPEFFETFNIPLERLGFFSKKESLAYSYEDKCLELINSKCFLANNDRWMGKSAKRIDVIIVRDPYNLFASRLKQETDINKDGISLKTDQQRDILINLWKQYAKEYLDETHILQNNKVPISYNRWAHDKEYRKELADKLNLNFTDATINQVLSVGGGSSFDLTSKDNNAKQMKVLERWKFYQDDELFKNIFKDNEINELSNRIFGEIPGVKEWLKTL